MKKKNLVIAMLTLAAVYCSAFTYMYTTQMEQNCIQNEKASGEQYSAQRTVKGKKEKVLVVYFSVPETDGMDAASGASRIIIEGKLMGNTQYVASVIAEATKGDLFEIKTIRTYPSSHKALVDAAKEESDNKIHPRLSTHIKNLKDYDVVFIGFPNWWYDMPMPLYTFFEEYDFSGKTLVPFCTHGGSRFSNAVNTIRSLEKNATVLDGHAISRDHVEKSKDGILKWIEKIGMKQ